MAGWSGEHRWCGFLQVQALIQGRASAWQQNLVLTPTKAGAGEAVRPQHSLFLHALCLKEGCRRPCI